MRRLPKKYRNFIIGLEKLTRETGVAITGCGCCGSPKLIPARITHELSGYGSLSKVDLASEIHWIDPKNAYDWRKYSSHIIK